MEESISLVNRGKKFCMCFVEPAIFILVDGVVPLCPHVIIQLLDVKHQLEEPLLSAFGFLVNRAKISLLGLDPVLGPYFPFNDPLKPTSFCIWRRFSAPC